MSWGFLLLQPKHFIYHIFVLHYLGPRHLNSSWPGAVRQMAGVFLTRKLHSWIMYGFQSWQVLPVAWNAPLVRDAVVEKVASTSGWFLSVTQQYHFAQGLEPIHHPSHCLSERCWKISVHDELSSHVISCSVYHRAFDGNFTQIHCFFKDYRT